MFPLPDEFWQPPKLTMKQKKEYIDLGKRMLQMSTLVWSPSAASHVLATSHLLATGRESDENECYDGHVTWQFLKETQGVSLFRGDSNGSVIPDVRAVGKITATMDEVMDMIICDTTAEYRTMSKKFNDDFLDGQVIHTIIPRTEDHPNRYMGIKWMALKSPKGFKTRDYCFLEYIDVCRNKMGHRAGFRVAQSIDMYDVVPSLEETHDIIRGHMLRDCHIFSASGHRGSLKITHTIKLNPQGKLSNRVTRRMMEKSALNILNVEKYIEAERISQMRFVDVTEFISPKAQADCGICHRNIHLFRPGQNCITCGNLICSSCALVRQLDLPVVGNRKVRICHNCVLISRHCPEERELELLQQEEVKIQEVERPVELQTQVLADQLSLESQRLISTGPNKLRIVYGGPYAKVCLKVVVTGSWCDWRTDVDFGAVPLERNENDVWTATLRLARGTYYYKFFVDGHLWSHDTGTEDGTKLEQLAKHGLNRVAHIGLSLSY